MSEHKLTTGFMVIHGNQPELLRQLLVHWFKAHPLDPLEDEAIVVQSKPLLRHLGLKVRRPYQCRHTAATLWLGAGESFSIS